MYTRQQAIDFWYEFDQLFLFARTDEVNTALGIAYPGGDLDGVVDLVRDTPQANLASVIAARAPGIQTLARLQLEMMDRFFPAVEDLQRAFEDFGQGVLMDTPARRLPTQLIHMMNGTPDTWVGYHRWHAFARCASAVSVNAASVDAARWDQINKLIALAWAIQTQADPKVDDPTNPGLGETTLHALRGWLKLDLAALNGAFLAYSGRFGQPDFQGSVRAPELSGLMYRRVTEILARAAGNSNPMHSGKRRFWTLPEQAFLTVNVYGQDLIAPPGPARGSRSALVRILRDELPGFPRMPLDRPPVADEDIAFIESWIDLLETVNPVEAEVAARRAFAMA